MAKAATNTAQAADTVEASVTPSATTPASVTPTPVSTPAPASVTPSASGANASGANTSGANTALGPALSSVTTPEAAASALKAKVSILHTTAHNSTNVSTLALGDIEQLLSDMRWLVSYIRSKV